MKANKLFLLASLLLSGSMIPITAQNKKEKKQHREQAVRDAEKTFVVTKMAYDAGVFINPVIPPACAPQDTLVRFALMATHTREQVEQAVQILKKIFVEEGIIK